MLISSIIHIPLIASVHLGLTFLWNLKMSHRKLTSRRVWLLALFGSLFNVWGLDVILRDFEVDSIYEVLQVSLGCWLVFVLATNVKYWAIYGWSKREFWLDCGGDLLCFLLSGILIYLAT